MRLRTRFSDSPILKSTVGVIELIQMTNAIDHFVASIDHATPMWGTSGWWTKQPLSTPAEKMQPLPTPTRTMRPLSRTKWRSCQLRRAPAGIDCACCDLRCVRFFASATSKKLIKKLILKEGQR